MFKLIIEDAVITNRAIAVVTAMTELSYELVTQEPSRERLALLRYKLCKQQRKFNVTVKRFGYRTLPDSYFDVIETNILETIQSYTNRQQFFDVSSMDRHFNSLVRGMAIKATSY